MKDIKIEIRWALLFTLISMIWMFVEVNFLNWHDKYISSQFGNHFLILIILFAVVYYFALREKRNQYYKRKITWKQAFLSGCVISVIVALLSPLAEYFNYHYLSPQYFDHMIAYQTEKASHPMTLEAAKDFFNMKSFLIQGIFTSFSFGFLVSLLLALVVRTKKKK